MRRELASLIANPEFQFCRRLEDVQCLSCHFCLSFSISLSTRVGIPCGGAALSVAIQTCISVLFLF